METLLTVFTHPGRSFKWSSRRTFFETTCRVRNVAHSHSIFGNELSLPSIQAATLAPFWCEGIVWTQALLLL